MSTTILYSYIALWPFLHQVTLLDLGTGVPAITVGNVTITYLLAYTLFSHALRKDPIVFGPSFRWLLVYLVLCGVSVMLNGVPNNIAIAQQLFQVYMLPFSIFFIIKNLKGRVDPKRIGLSVIVGAIPLTGVGVAELVTSTDLFGNIAFDPIGEAKVNRIDGPVGDNITYAALLVLYFCAAYYVTQKGLVNRKLGYFAVWFSAFGSFVCFSRAVWAVLGLSSIILLLKRNWVVMVSVVLLLVLAFLSSFVFTDFFSDLKQGDFFDDRLNSENVRSRWNSYQYLLRNAREAWILGIGYSNYRFQHTAGTFWIYLQDSHNSYLQVLVEVGVVGLVVFLGFMFSILFSDLDRERRERDKEFFLTKLCIAAVVVMVPNTVSILHSEHFMTGLFVITGALSIVKDAAGNGGGIGPFRTRDGWSKARSA